MRILIAVTTDIAFDQRVLKIAGSLAKYGHQVRVLGRSKGIDHKLDASFEYKLIKCWFAKSFMFYAEYNLRLFFILLKSNCDIICACDLDTILGSAMAAFLKNKKLVFDAHEYFEESIEIIHKKGIKKAWEWIGRICVPRTSLRYTVSQSLASELSTNYGREFQLIRNVPLTSYDILKESSQKIIWYQGAINEGRGLECMIECLLELPDYSFYLAGDGDILSGLQSKVNMLNLEKRVHFLGRLSYSAMLDYSTLAFVGIDLLESASKSYYFSLSNKTFDYMHAGLPSIQVNFPEYKAIHDQYKIGVLIDKVDSKSILAAIHKLEDDDFYEQCVSGCKVASKIFNWEEEEKRLIGLYDSIAMRSKL